MIAKHTPIVITAPSDLPVTLKEAQDQTNSVAGDDDGLLRRLIATATSTVETDAGVKLCLQTVQLNYYDIKWDNAEIEVPEPYYPVNAIVAVNYRDAAGVLQTVNNAIYQASFDRPTRLKPYPNQSWPSIEPGYYDSLAVTLEVGAVLPPEQAKHAILLLVAHWYLNREAALIGAVSSEIKLAYTTLINQLKLYRYP
jgi:uncharacterized phiE125 gp8 family phage protein